MYGVMEWTSTKAAAAPSSSAVSASEFSVGRGSELSLASLQHPAPTGLSSTATSSVFFQVATTRHAPKASSDEKDAIRLPFSFELPTTLDRYPTPPSFQRDGFGVRYFLEVSRRRSVEDEGHAEPLHADRRRAQEVHPSPKRSRLCTRHLPALVGSTNSQPSYCISD